MTDTLTVEKLTNTMRMFGALTAPAPAPRLHGLEVIVSHHLPRPLIGHHVQPMKARWGIAWLRRWFTGSDVFMWLKWPMYGEPDVVRMGNKLFVSPRQFHILKEHPND